jgi:cytochrome P450
VGTAAPTTTARARTPSPRAPGPSGGNPVAFFAEFRRDPLGYLERLQREHGDVVALGWGPLLNFVIYHPADIKRVLQDNNQNYVKGAIIARTKIVIGEGLFTSEGDFWRRQRRLAQPAFHRKCIASFVDTMTDSTAAMLRRWDGLARDGATFDAAAEMSRVTLAVVGRTLFGVDLDGEAAAVGRALGDGLAFTNQRATSYMPLPMWVPTARHRRFKAALRVLDDLVFSIIENRRRNASAGDDLLGMMMDARDADTGEGMSDRRLRDEVMTFLLAGHETTAVTLAWTFYLLGRHPEVEARLRDEIERVLSGRAPTIDDMPSLPYTRMVIEEAMRLYPPVAGIGRQTVGPDVLGGYAIPKNTLVTISVWATHRHRDFWDDPLRFDPERFSPERSGDRPRFAYLPFSGGPRLCIGYEFALVEAQIILAMVLQRHRVRLAVEGEVTPEMTLTTRPRGGVPVRLERVRAGDSQVA